MQGLSGYYDAFVTKIRTTGHDLYYSTYLGGSGSETAHDVAVDSQGNAYVAGSTTSDDFPTTPNAFQPMLNPQVDAFVSKLNPNGNFTSTAGGPMYSTYLGGTGWDLALAIAVTPSGDAFVAGLTESLDFPKPDAMPPPPVNVTVFITRIH
jgi:hypothetical protein